MVDREVVALLVGDLEDLRGQIFPSPRIGVYLAARLSQAERAGGVQAMCAGSDLSEQNKGASACSHIRNGNTTRESRAWGDAGNSLRT